MVYVKDEGAIKTAIDIAFTVFMCILMIVVRPPKRGDLRTIFHSITFWIYLLFCLNTCVSGAAVKYWALGGYCCVESIVLFVGRP